MKRKALVDIDITDEKLCSQNCQYFDNQLAYGCQCHLKIKDPIYLVSSKNKFLRTKYCQLAEVKE